MTQLTDHFTREELACGHCGQMNFSDDDLNQLELLRVLFDYPMPISSGYRCPEHNAQVSTTGAKGPHTLFAVDITVSGARAWRLVRVAMEAGWTGIGLHQRGPMGMRYIHLDRLPIGGAGHPRPAFWTY